MGIDFAACVCSGKCRKAEWRRYEKAVVKKKLNIFFLSRATQPEEVL
jgi:hypothetical protein